ncbi:DUF4469 domain-containing protein [Parabacteroides sp.]
MAANDSKMRSIAGTLVANKLTAREDDFTFNVTYLANWNIDALCRFAVTRGKSKFTESELRSAYNDLFSVAQDEVYSGSTVEFGFCTNSLGVDGPFIGPGAKFDPAKNSVNLRCTPRSVFRKDLDNISVIVGEIKEGLPTISRVTDVYTQSVNDKLTPGNSLNGEGNRIKIVGTEGNTIGFFFVNAETEAETAVPITSVSRNDPSYFTFIIPALADGKYYLDIATQYGGNSKTLLKEPRRNRLPYLLTVGNGGNTDDDDRPVIE